MSQPLPSPHSILSRLAAPLALVLVTHAPSVSAAAGLPVLGPTALGGPTLPPLLTSGEPGAGHNRIDGLTVEELDDGTTLLHVQGSRKPTFNVYRLSDPERLVVDIAGSEPGKVVPHVPLDTWACGRVTVDGVTERDATLVRLVVELKRESSYIVVPKGSELVVTVTPREMAPEAYFARKSAHERRAEIERTARDAKALEAEARALSSHAKAQAQEADRKVAEAATRAEEARSAEARAKEAEQRAAELEVKARTSLGDAKSGKLKLRRELRAAEEARAAAESERKLAQADRKAAEQALGRARAELEAERATLAKARGEVESERDRLAVARGQAEADAAAAAAELAKAREKNERAEAEAGRVLDAARMQLSQAQTEAERAQAEAKATLAKAEKEAARAAAAARDADAAAKKTLDEAAAKAEQELRRARTDADAAQAEAKRELSRAKAAVKKAEQEAQAKQAQAAEAERRAKALLAEARAKVEFEQQQAQVERDKAEADARRRADALLADAQAQADAKVAAATAAAKRQAEDRLAEAEAEAERRLAEAQKQAERSAVKEAERELAKIRAQADKEVERTVAAARKKAEKDAQADLAKAKQRAAAIEAEARAKLESAQTTLARAEADAKATMDRADADAKAKMDRAEADAQATRANAQTTLAQAEAEARAKLASAQTTLAQAEADAQAKKKSAAELERQAREALARAEQALTKAQAERSAAASARTRADQDLEVAERRVRRARKRGQETAELEKSVAVAKQAKADADKRLTAAQTDLRKLASDRDALEQTLEQQRETSRALAGRIETRSKELQRLEQEVADARAALKEAGGSATQQEVRRAKDEAAQAKKAQAELSAELTRLRGAAKAADDKAAAAERRVAQLEESGARRKAVAEAKQEAEAAQGEAKAAKSQLRDARQRLEAIDATVRDRQAELTRLQRDRDALASEGATLRERNAAAKAELEQAEQRLARLRTSLESEQDKLAQAQQEVAKAQRALDERVAQREASTPAAAPGRAPKAQDAASTAPSDADRPTIRDVRFEDDGKESRVIVELEGPVHYEGKSLTPDIQMLALDGARIDPSLERSLDASAYAGPVQRITSFAENGGAKVIVATNGPAKPRLEQGDGQLVWHFPHDGKTAAPTHEVASLPGSKVGGYAASTVPPMAAARTAAMAPAPNAPRTIGASEPTSQAPVRGTRFRGERIDIELQDAPIKDVLLLFSDIGRVNIIAGKDVEGSVTMKLTAVPWDQALDIILRSLELGMVREGNVIRVATNEALETERRLAIERANARVQLKPLETRLVPVSYATVDEMVPKVQSVLSPRGTVTPDSRTNTLIIMDVSDNIAIAEQLVGSLDTQTPQVLIEARIVEARTNFQRQLGIQWGFDFTASPGTGNPTGLLFPNSAGIAGGATGVPPDRRGLILPAAAANPNYVVDLPAPVGTGTGGALGFSFGSISGNLNTNLRLSQAEETGEVRIISAPKIVTLDNSEAQIEQGVQIPISQVSAQGVNTRFVNATLSLRVTPHVTNEGAVLLDVQVQKNEADFINTGARGDPTILTKQAQSRMLVNDSDTAVIGGIYTRNKAVNFSKVPWLADIPIIGWFFKNKSEADTRSEVLIFLTPKIVNRASSIGG